MNTLEEKLKCFSLRQEKRSNQDQNLYKAMGTINMDDLKTIIYMNLIKNNMVITEDLNLCKKAYDLDVSGIKVKITRSRPTAVVNNILKRSDELM